ncbi:MAG: radical SAM protein [Planctomycetaceae bacterium]|nr:radical SAM protein [Planctomycetaceae bacterium]
MSNFNPCTDSYKILCWHLTKKCTQNCEFCLSQSNSLNKINDLKEYKKIINIIKELGFDKISYSGGEPFIVPIFEELVNYGKELKLTQIVTTNGDCLSKGLKNIEFLKKFQYIKLSFYGLQNYHDQLIKKGHFQQLINLLHILQSNTVKVGINYMLTKQSYFELPYFLEYISKFRLYNLLIQSYIPTGNFKIDNKYQINDESNINLSFLSSYKYNFEQGIKYFNYNIKEGFQVILDEKLNLYFPNQNIFEYGNIFETEKYFEGLGIIYLKELIEHTVQKRISSNSIIIY